MHLFWEVLSYCHCGEWLVFLKDILIFVLYEIIFHEKVMVCPNICIEVVLKKYGRVLECSGILLKLALWKLAQLCVSFKRSFKMFLKMNFELFFEINLKIHLNLLECILSNSLESVIALLYVSSTAW